MVRDRSPAKGPHASKADAPGNPGARKAYRDGTHRTVSPEQTIETVTPLLPAMGITRVANVTGLDYIGIPVVMVTRPNSRSLAVSQGKGLDLAAAKASGLMEAIELYHAEHIVRPLMRSSYAELSVRAHVVDVNELPWVTRSRFTPGFRLLWIEGHEIVSNQAVWVPYELVHCDYTLPLPEGTGCFPLSSNGLASGNHLYEAISHAINEVVERDATTIFQMLDPARQEELRIDPDSIDDPACRFIMALYEEADIAFGIWDMTSDIGLPAFFCTIIDSGSKHFKSLYAASGMGCHVTREVALLRALTEAAQSRLTFISGARDDATKRRYSHSLREDVNSYIRKTIERPAAHRNFADTPSFPGETLEDDVAVETECLVAAGFNQVIVVDLSREEFGIPVVRVIIPGLEGSDHNPQLAPGRRARAAKGTGS